MAVTLALESVLWKVIPTPLRGLPPEPTRPTNHLSSTVIPTMIAVIAEVMSGPSPLSATRRITRSTTSHLRGRKHHRLRRSFRFQTYRQSSVSTLPKGRPQSSGLPDLPPRFIPPSPLQSCAPPKRVRISIPAKSVGVKPPRTLELPSAVVGRKPELLWKRNQRRWRLRGL